MENWIGVYYTAWAIWQYNPGGAFLLSADPGAMYRGSRWRDHSGGFIGGMMSLRDRTLLLVAFLLIFTVFVTTLALSWALRQALMEQAEASGKVVAQLLATSAGYSQHVPAVVERIVGEQIATAAGQSETGAGVLQSALQEIDRNLGLQRVIDRLVGSGDVLAAYVVDSQAGILAVSVLPGSAASTELSPADRALLQAALEQRQVQASLSLDEAAPSYSLLDVAAERIRTIGLLGKSLLRVAAPVGDLQGQLVGAVLVYLPTDRVQIALVRQLQIALVVAAFTLIYGFEASIVWSRRVTRPLRQLKQAALDVEVGQFDPKSLVRIEKRRDELGQLARTFSRMAVEVQAREQRLKDQVQVLRIQIDEARRDREVTEITDTEYFRKLQARAQALRARK
jgi:HAMP domain-containing protein